MLKNIIEKTRGIITNHINGSGSDLVLTNTNDDRILIDMKEIHQKGFEQCLREYIAALPPRQTIDEQTGYLLIQDEELLKKQGAALFYLIGSHGQLPKDISPEYAEKILFGAAFKVKDGNGDSAFTLACAEIKDEKLDRGIIKKIHFKLTNKNGFLRDVIGKLIDFGNADEISLQNAAKNTALSILIYKNEPTLAKQILEKEGITHKHILSTNYFPRSGNLLGGLERSSKLEGMLKNALSTLSNKEFMQYWAMREDILFS